MTRAGAARAGAALLMIQVEYTTVSLFDFDVTTAYILVNLLITGFMPALIFASAFQITTAGPRRAADQK